jgi:ATP-dependent exoDNAse (exonuclease V) beta subunit
VIVPFLSRKVIPFSPRYPSIVKVPDSEEAIAALYKEDCEEEVRDALKILQRQEMERLLYVALTRARHTLVLALDRELFASAKEKKISEDSQLSLLRGDTGQATAEILARLAEDGDECADTIAAWKALENESSAASPQLPAIDTALIEAAKRNANAIIRKHNPSGFTEPNDSDVPPAGRARHSIADTPATLYGSWWHSLFEHFPWKGDPAAWTAAFETLQPQSPDPKRSAREWRLLSGGALRDSMLTNFLSRAGVVIHTEFPLLWRMDEQSSLEGVIDLLAIDLERRSCLLIDWKTNRIAPGEEPALVGRYRPQLSAYWKAVSEITGFTVEAGLYSTATGKLLIPSPDDLAAEWSRLSKLSAEELQSTTTAPDFH